ncbi:AcrB/AcrD/AcrF family protein [Agrobacterium vitis]|uniref:AcrB/AcrD/AcrF family protein n=1 Tax=Agrobacterium vitis TaxID=373 RepID=A0ABD6GCJ4_AGRVI|nr:AcrB/AcrD/AcrF family protein [Agrobacterium vitis]MUO96450.1 AcrB/AcrD/AcrF family protein [Agrobacterium vitis]MUP07167.1 AcrB/AcrD/AcrF family protein [Agrobacterium vitis]MUZ82100.1 AcrB/AcrD/AcrF family protein [Agrobacterium vitis]MVA09832.1 AcrB/AcrD/AcrF family protein [Agrobacterium vitis]
MSEQSPQSRARFNLSKWALGHQSFVIFLMFAAIISGILSYQKLSRNEDPPFTIKTMVVGARWPGASATDTVNLLTDKLEKKLSETPHLDYTQSYTRPGQSVIMVNLRDDTPPAEVDGIWYTVRKKISDITSTLPEGVEGPFFDDEFGDTYGSIYAFRAEGINQRELRDRVEAIRGEILSLPDIGKVNILGTQDEQIVIEFAQSKLASLGIDPSAAIEAIRAQNSVNPIGTVRTSEEKISVRVTGAFASEDSLKDITLKLGSRYFRLDSIATISRTITDPPAASVRVNGKEVIGLAVSMAKDGNLLSFGEALKDRMHAIASNLPYGIEMIQVADQSAVVKDAVNGFMKVLVEAIVIVLAVSFVSLGARAGLVITASIPIVLALTFLGMELTGVGLQRISLGALIIALGLLVDDAMITVESMVSCLEKGKSRLVAATHAYETTAFPMLTGTLVMIAGFIPVGFAASSAGEYTLSLFMVILIALSSSWIVAVLFSPILGTWILPRSLAHTHKKTGIVMATYRKILGWNLKHRWLTILLATAAFALSLGGLGQLKQQFFPASDRPELLVSLTLPQNASRAATDIRARELEAILRTDRDIDHFITYVGSGSIRFYLPMDLQLDNDNVTETVVVAKSVEKRESVRRKIEAVLNERFSDIVTRVSPLELGPPVGWPLKFRVSGPDYQQVRALSTKVAAIIGQNPDTRDVNLTAGEPQKSVTIKVNQIEARTLGMSSESIASEIAAVFSGSKVTTVRDKDKLVDVMVKGVEADRNSVSTIGNLELRTGDGNYVPLRQVASVAYGMEDPIIWRQQGKPMITVQADVEKNALAAMVAEQADAQLNALRAELPMGYSIIAGGITEESEKGNSSIYAVIPVMLFAIAVLLMVQMQSFSRMALALFMAPFGLIGVVAAMWPTGTPMGFVAQLGVIALCGMIIRNAVILIQEIDQNVALGQAPKDAIIAAAIHRARPIVLTACAAILGMIPIAAEIFWGPMAFAIIGGLAVATVLTLTLLPCAMSLLLNAEQKSRSNDDPNGKAEAQP